MEASTEYPGVREGDGYAVGHIDDLGEGPGFRKVRKGLGVTAFGVNAIVMPPGIESGFHYHELQEELYFVHRGVLEIEFGDGSVERLGEGCLARVDAATGVFPPEKRDAAAPPTLVQPPARPVAEADGGGQRLRVNSRLEIPLAEV